jgi:hypothetical protein
MEKILKPISGFLALLLALLLVGLSAYLFVNVATSGGLW